MIATLGDLVEDIVIRVTDPVNVASDTAAVIERRQGGSAANVARSAARHGAPARFIGRVGTDAIGSALVDELRIDGVDVSCVQRVGRTGTIVVLVDAAGERTMLTDRGACGELDEPVASWLDGVSVVHLPMYSLWGGATATTAATVIRWADDRVIPVSIDVSSVSLIEEIGPAAVRAMLDDLAPDVLFANVDEAATLAIDGSIGGAVTVVKRGAAATTCFRADGGMFDIPVEPLDAVGDTTGAGDAFAAGFLAATWSHDLRGAVEAGHALARAHLALR